MSFPRGELHRWAVCRRAAEIWGMDHESGVGFPPSGPPASWGEIHRSSFDLSYAICQRVSIMREDPDQAFSRQIDTPFISSLVCRSGPPRTNTALGGEGQQSLSDPMDLSSSFSLRSHLTPIGRYTGRLQFSCIQNPEGPK